MSFKCQFSGEKADNREKPVRLVVETRYRKYVNVINREPIESEGTEIVKELLVRAKHVDAVKKRYGLV
jgi:hypothetical protein